MKTLITQSLLSSWLYTYNCMEGFEEEAEADFLRTLRREPMEEPSEAIQNGIAFENGVYALVNNPKDITVYPAWRQASERIANIIRGGQIQVKVQRDIEVDGETYLLYGILDALKAGIIYDVKFSNNSFGKEAVNMAGKYLESPQHPAYLYCLPEAWKFIYLCSDGTDLYTEEYTRAKTPFIGDTIRNFRNEIRRRGLEEIYLEKWGSK